MSIGLFCLRLVRGWLKLGEAALGEFEEALVRYCKVGGGESGWDRLTLVGQGIENLLA